MTKRTLDRIKEFAEKNFAIEDSRLQLTVTNDYIDCNVSNPWIDRTGRFQLDDEGAVKEWGLDLVMEFCKEAEKMLPEKEPVLCGFVWCHGRKDFSVWETDALSVQDRNAIEDILNKYASYGTCESGVWDEKISEVFREEY